MNLPLKVKIYIFIIFIMALLSFVFVATQIREHNFDPHALIFWTILAIITESLVIKLPNGMGLSVGLAISLAALLSNGAITAMVATGFGLMLRIIKNKETGKIIHVFNNDPVKTLFNTSQGVISVALAGIGYYYTGGTSGVFNAPRTIIAVISYTLINSGIMTLFFSLMTGSKFISSWLANLKGIILNVILVGIMGIILFLAYDSYGMWAVILFFAPLLLARYAFQQYLDLRSTYLDTIKAFNKLTEAKDLYTGEHSSRVEKYAVELAKYMGLENKKIENVRMASILHDIGKIGVCDKILTKNSALTDEEFKKMSLHPILGAEIIKNVHFLSEASDIIRQHHERPDGKGYPAGLSGNEIRIEAKIISIADTYDSITSKRPYKDPMSFEEAIKEIEDNAGSQFDPLVVSNFVELANKNPEVFKKDVV